MEILRSEKEAKFKRLSELVLRALCSAKEAANSIVNLSGKFLLVSFNSSCSLNLLELFFSAQTGSSRSHKRNALSIYFSFFVLVWRREQGAEDTKSAYISPFPL
jgi:hypothetical protein